MDELFDSLCRGEEIERLLLGYKKGEEEAKNNTEADKDLADFMRVIREAFSVIFAILLCNAGNDKYEVLDRSGKNEEHSVVNKIMGHVREATVLGLEINELTQIGHYHSALALLRILYEAVIKAVFYASFPDEAVAHLSVGSRDGREIDHLEMANRLDWNVKEIGRDFGALSKFNHASSLAKFTITLAPTFDEKLSYVLLVRTVQEMRKLILALGKVFSASIHKQSGLWSKAALLIERMDTIEEDIDHERYRLEIIGKIDVE